MARRRRWTLLFALLGLLACARDAHKPSVAPSQPRDPSSLTKQPKLVVLIVLDQLGQWVWEKYLPLLPEDGGLRQAEQRGSSLRASYPYANTATAPGHATLATGVTPSVHGIVANEVYEPDLGSRPIVDDGRHAVIGGRERYAAPTMLRAPTVADMLHERSGGSSQILALSMKARSAVLSVGRQADLALFYDLDAGGLTTSTYYAPKGVLPDWLSRFNAQVPIAQRLGVWEPADPSLLREHLGPDEGPGEGQVFGWSSSFPHAPRIATEPLEAFCFTPQATELLFETALAAVEARNLGGGDWPDFLVLSVSGTDLVGHVWGPSSWEYADTLLRTDKALSRFVEHLERRGPVAFVLTSDHGVAPMPESLHRSGGSAGRLGGAELVRRAEAIADEVLGPGDWIAAYVPPLLSYTNEGKSRRQELGEALAARLPELEAIHRAYDAQAGHVLSRSEDPLDRLVGASLPLDPPGDLYVVTSPHWFDELSQTPGQGSNHGTPWPYDRRVPVLMWGTGIERFRSDHTFDTRQVATTLANLLRVPPPSGAPKSPLPGLAPPSH